MKKSITSMFVAMIFLAMSHVCSAQDYQDVAEGIKNSFRADVSTYQRANKAVAPSVWTDAFAYQYTVDGWLQQVAIYADTLVCTNLEGPREGLQLVFASNGALLDMCKDYKSHKDHVTHKYSWGEIRTYVTYQIVSFK